MWYTATHVTNLINLEWNMIIGWNCLESLDTQILYIAFVFIVTLHVNTVQYDNMYFIQHWLLGIFSSAWKFSKLRKNHNSLSMHL